MKRKENGRLSWTMERRPRGPVLFTTDDGSEGEDGSREARLERRLARLEKINGALMRRVERSMDHHANAYSLFQAAIVLEDEVRARTTQLSKALSDLERTNREVSQAKEAAERSNATKTRFLAAASHDLLQPLNAARLCMSALKDEDLQESPAQLIRQIDRSLTTVEQLLRALLDISKLDAGVTQPEIRCFAIDDVLRSIYSDFAPDAAQRGLRLRVLSDAAIGLRTSLYCVQSCGPFLQDAAHAADRIFVDHVSVAIVVHAGKYMNGRVRDSLTLDSTHDNSLDETGASHVWFGNHQARNSCRLWEGLLSGFGRGRGQAQGRYRAYPNRGGSVLRSGEARWAAGCTGLQ